MSLIKEAGRGHEEMIKEAVVGLLTGAGKFLIKRPWTALSVGFDAQQMVGGVKQFRKDSLLGKNLMQNAAASVPPGSM